MLYIATDEMTPHFFDPLKSKYQVFVIDDFERFWAPGSQWHTTYTDMLGPNPEFDDTMKVCTRCSMHSRCTKQNFDIAPQNGSSRKFPSFSCPLLLHASPRASHPLLPHYSPMGSLCHSMLVFSLNIFIVSHYIASLPLPILFC